MRQEEAAAVEAALAGLPDHEREAVVAHEVEGVDTATLAEARRSTPGAVGVQLARTRARLRLDYLLALRRVELPAARCRPVLLALWWLWRRIQAWARQRPVLASLTAASAVAVAAWCWRRPWSPPTRRPGRRRPRPPCRPGGGLRGRRVGGAAGRARAVPAPRPRPGGPGQARRPAGPGRARPGQGRLRRRGVLVRDRRRRPAVGAARRPGRVALPGAVRASGQLHRPAGPEPAGFAQRVGMVSSEGAALARRQGHHIEVAYANITLEP